MKARGLLFRTASVVDWVAEPIGWLGAGIAFLVLAYLLAAPPVLLAHARQTGSGSFPVLYGPVLWIIETDFGGPMVWYFNNVWHAELVLIGGDEGPPWYIVATYIVVGAMLFVALVLPVFKRWCRRKAELGSAAEWSQSIGSLTNRTSSAAASGG